MLKIKSNFYICKLALYFSLWFKFFSAWFYFLSKYTKERGRKLTGKNLDIYSQFFKDVICIFWCYSVQPNCRGVGAAPILKKNCNQFPLLLFINTPSQMIKWRILYILSNPFYYNPPPCTLNLLLINHIFSLKSKLKHAGVGITWHKKCFGSILWNQSNI